MRIISWNCGGGFRKKVEFVDALNPDVVIIQECEDPSQSTSRFRNWAGEHLWEGESKNKGIGVFALGQNSIEQLDWSGMFELSHIRPKSTATRWKTEDLRQFLPFRINGRISCLAVWTKGNQNDAFRYIGQLWKYIQIHRTELASPATLVVGDFNSNRQWDQADRWWNHTDVVAELASLGLNSVYHQQFGETQGNETTNTFYHYRKIDKPYHIDYAFCSSDLTEMANLAVGKFDDWIALSDHMPLILDL